MAAPTTMKSLWQPTRSHSVSSELDVVRRKEYGVYVPSRKQDNCIACLLLKARQSADCIVRLSPPAHHEKVTEFKPLVGHRCAQHLCTTCDDSWIQISAHNRSQRRSPREVAAALNDFAQSCAVQRKAEGGAGGAELGRQLICASDCSSRGPDSPARSAIVPLQR
eukprot:6953980-Prymnesium_polylepis.1